MRRGDKTAAVLILIERVGAMIPLQQSLWVGLSLAKWSQKEIGSMPRHGSLCCFEPELDAQTYCFGKTLLGRALKNFDC